MCVIAVFVALMVIMSALPIAVSAPEDDIKTIQEPYSYVRYYNGSTEIAAYKYYYTQEVDVKFDIIPADPNRIFVGWSTSEFGPAKYYTDFNTGDRLDEIGGNRTFIMGGEDVNLYAVWLDESLVEKIGTHGTTSYTIKPDIKGVIISKPPSNGIITNLTIGGDTSDTFYILLLGDVHKQLKFIHLSGVNGNVKFQLINTTNVSGSSTSAPPIELGPNINFMVEGRDNAILNVVSSTSGSSDTFGAAIGSRSGINTGKIQFESGVVNVTYNHSSSHGASIGGGSGGSSYVIINGGTVIVNHNTRTNSTYYGMDGSGIGGGRAGNGTVAITGGIITVNIASANNSLLTGAGIGGGGSIDSSIKGGSGLVTVTGGQVDVAMEAVSDTHSKGAAIGGGGNNKTAGVGGKGDILITGGTVTTSRTNFQPGADIGSGFNGDAPIIEVSGGSVKVSSNGNVMEYVIGSRYVINASDAGGAKPESFLVAESGDMIYSDYKISDYHDGDDKFYLYLPSDSYIVSLEYDSDGKVLVYGKDGDLISGENTPATGDYYRVEYYLDNLTFDIDEDELVHYRAPWSIGNREIIANTVGEILPQMVFFDEYTTSGQILHKLKDGVLENGEVSYERIEPDKWDGAVTFEAAGGKHVFVGNSITGYNVTYCADLEYGAVFDAGNPSKLPDGEGLEFKVLPNAGYVITEISWSTDLDDTDQPLAVRADGEYAIPVQKGHVFVTVTAVPEYEIVLIADEASSGTFEYSLNGGVAIEYTDAPIKVISTDTLSVTATTVEHFRFIEWDDDIKTETRDIPTNKSDTYTATFLPEYTVVLTPDGSGVISYVFNGSSGSDSSILVTAADTLEIIANAYSGNRFIGWDDGNADSPRSVDLNGISEDVEFTAMFVPEYEIVLIADEASSGMFEYSLNGEDAIEYTVSVKVISSDSLSVTAMAVRHFRFAEWDDGGVKTATRNIPTDANGVYTAHFAAVPQKGSQTGKAEVINPEVVAPEKEDKPAEIIKPEASPNSPKEEDSSQDKTTRFGIDWFLIPLFVLFLFYGIYRYQKKK